MQTTMHRIRLEILKVFFAKVELFSICGLETRRNLEKAVGLDISCKIL